MGSKNFPYNYVSKYFCNRPFSTITQVNGQAITTDEANKP